MQTIKTGVVIALLIAVCYGAFVALNAPESDIPDSIQDWANATELDELTGDVGGFDLSQAQPASPDALLGGFELPTSTAPSDIPQFPEPTFPNSVPSQPIGFQTPLMPDLPGSTAEPSGLPLPTSSGSLIVESDSLAQSASPATEGPSIPFNTALPSPTGQADLGGSFDSPSSLASPTPESLGGIAGSASAVGLTNAGGLAEPETLPLLAAPETSNSAAAESRQSAPMPELPFQLAREQALLKASGGSLKEALEMLSAYYNSPELDYEEHSDLVDILDALSQQSIYSSRHLIEPSYTVTANDTVASVADKHQISPELLAAINGLGDAKALVAGSTLKVVQGPFRAVVSMKGELTLFLGNLYAGRFPIEIGTDQPLAPGVFEVVDRRRDRTYFDTHGAVIQANEPKNPYGGYWLSLGGNLSIHGSPQIEAPELANAGCISLAPLDAADVYNILTKNSQVEIVR